MLLLLPAVASPAADRDYPHQPVSFTGVKWTDNFWRPRIETNRTVTIPYAFEKSEETGRIENFKVAGGLSEKAWTGGFGFNDSDVSKIIEGASGPFIAMPSRKRKDGTFQDIAHPINMETREWMEAEIIAAYEAVAELMRLVGIG